MKRKASPVDIGLAAACVLQCAAPAGAQRAPADPGQVDLCRALGELVRSVRVDILYDPGLCRGRQARQPVRGTPVEKALAALLAGTGIGYRRTADGVFVLFAAPASPPPADEEGEGAINEILVTARRTQNADIRRTENDIQPYRVATGTDVERAHRDDVDGYMRSRVPANADLAAPAQNTYVEAGSVRSQIDLRGLGPARTLVLIDGRRVPSFPTGSADFFQSDLNGIPVSAIERIETLTGTAGGIYGPGAIGGVVNIVLKRDYRGADIRLTSGLSSRGDAARWGVEGRVGFSPDEGRTDVMVLAALSRSATLLTGDRDYVLRARRLAYKNDPATYGLAQFTANSVGLLSVRGDLVLDQEKGGTPLASRFTFLPLNFSGSEAARLSLLAANAGKVDISISDDQTGTGRSLVARPEVFSLLVNARHRFGSGVEGFADLVYYSNAGRLQDNPGSPFFTTLANAPTNPFGQDIVFSYPEPNVSGVSGLSVETRRLTFGLIADLPTGWKANIDYALGRTSAIISQRRVVTTSSYLLALRSGAATPPKRTVDPLGNWREFVAASATYLEESGLTARLVNRFTDISLRLAGPLATLRGGPLTLTMLAESRRERVPPTMVSATRGATRTTAATPDRSVRVRSAYAELRAPIVPDGSRKLLRGLELQLAARADSVRTVVPVQPSFGFPSNDDLLRIGRRALTFTGGARLFPHPRLMLRGSVATGDLPPTIQQLSSVSSFFGVDVTGVGDPLRGGRRPGTEGTVEELQGGRRTMRSERARTVTLGAVFNPSGRRGPRIALDLSRIDRTREVTPFTPTRGQLIVNEALYPGRVVRAPASEADRVAGFGVGRIVALDLRLDNSGRSQVDSVDAQFDWRLAAPTGGEIRLRAAGTWQPRFRTRRSAIEPEFDRIGRADGPLSTRGNVGLEWSRGDIVAGLNLQYHAGYRVTYSDPAKARSNTQIVRYQGTERVPPQAYLDLYASRMLPVGAGRAELGLGISNVLDSSPPILAEPGTPGYSLYGDPRRRRVELTLASRF